MYRMKTSLINSHSSTERQPRKTSHILSEMQISEKMKTDFAPEIENPPKILNIIVQTIAYITTDMKIMKLMADKEMTPI